jgi:hypothetical protein
MVSGSISKLGSKGSRELNRLECSINFMMLNLRLLVVLVERRGLFSF